MNAMTKARLLRGGIDGLPRPAVPESESPPVVVSKVFPIQSFFNYLGQAVGAQALISQPPGTQIVNPQPRNDSGYSLGLAPWSQTPVVVSFKVGGQRSTSAPLLLKPGQIIRPQGKSGDKPANFNGFEYGLPFGWMGGGLATLFVFPSAEAEVVWSAPLNEVLFHCQQVQIRTTSLTPPAAPFLRNWPIAFPWNDCFRYDAVAGVALEQNGQPSLSITETTKVMLRLRGNIALTAPEACRALLWGTDAFEHGADGLTPTLTQSFFYDFAFPGNGVVAGMAANDPVAALPNDFFALGGSLAGITLDVVAGSPILGGIVDILRFGRLG